MLNCLGWLPEDASSDDGEVDAVIGLIRVNVRRELPASDPARRVIAKRFDSEGEYWRRARL